MFSVNFLYFYERGKLCRFENRKIPFVLKHFLNILFFVYFALLCTKVSEEFAFHSIMFVRNWCVDASFLFYAKKMNLSHLSALMGSIMYAFSHPVIYYVVRYPFFIHPMIFFPHICLGI